MVMSIDIGIQHLGISLSTYSHDYIFQAVTHIEMIDITKFECDRSTCQLKHAHTFADWISHVMQEKFDLFDQADVILIERQPPQGLVVIEQLIFLLCREKSILISPNSVHKHFYMNNLDYDQRKIRSNEIARAKLSLVQQEKLDMYDRSHDISDSILFTLFWLEREQAKLAQEKRLIRQKEARQKIVPGGTFTLDEYFDAFAYIEPLEEK